MTDTVETTRPLTTRNRVTLIRMLWDGQKIDTVAERLGRSVAEVRDVATEHGWPNRHAMHTQLQVLERLLHTEAEVADHGRPIVIEALLIEAEQHGSATIRHRAERVRKSILTLAELVEASRQAEQQRREQDQARQEAEQEIARLQEKLAQAKARVAATRRPRAKRTINRGPVSPEQRARLRKGAQTAKQQEQLWLQARGVTAAQVRRWARDHLLESRGSVISAQVRQAWDEAQPQVIAE